MPRVGGDVFRRLVKDAGLKYDRSKGFQATSETDLGMAVSILKGALREEVEVYLRCFICGRPVECGECGYREICDPIKVSQACICEGCLAKDEAPTLYALRFNEFSTKPS